MDDATYDPSHPELLPQLIGYLVPDEDEPVESIAKRYYRIRTDKKLKKNFTGISVIRSSNLSKYCT